MSKISLCCLAVMFLCAVSADVDLDVVNTEYEDGGKFGDHVYAFRFAEDKMNFSAAKEYCESNTIKGDLLWFSTPEEEEWVRTLPPIQNYGGGGGSGEQGWIGANRETVFSQLVWMWILHQSPSNGYPGSDDYVHFPGDWQNTELGTDVAASINSDGWHQHQKSDELHAICKIQPKHVDCGHGELESYGSSTCNCDDGWGGAHCGEECSTKCTTCYNIHVCTACVGGYTLNTTTSFCDLTP